MKDKLLKINFTSTPHVLRTDLYEYNIATINLKYFAYIKCLGIYKINVWNGDKQRLTSLKLYEIQISTQKFHILEDDANKIMEEIFDGKE